MKEIPLTQGKTVLVDDEDYKWLMQWKWHAYRDRRTWYAIRHVYPNGRKHPKKIRMHRFILNVLEGVKVDHRDGDGLNNQKGNLRQATTAQNGHNRRINSNNTSGFKGVSKRKHGWQATIQGKYLGVFDTPGQAASAYDRAASVLFGEFARTNESCIDHSS